TASVFVPQRPFLQRRHDRRRRRERLHAGFGDVEVETLERRADRELGERQVRRDQVTHCEVAALLAQLARVESIRLYGDERLRDEALIVGESLERGLPPCFVAVEGEDHP